MVKLDLNAIRLVRLSEAQAVLLMQAVEAVLDSRELALDAAARSTGRAILAHGTPERYKGLTPSRVNAITPPWQLTAPAFPFAASGGRP